MQIDTTFSNGDLGWVYHDERAQQLTIGSVRVEATHSPGVPGESMFSNYGPQNEYKEQYMCVETGIGTGSVYTLGVHIFETEDECLKANAERIAQREAAQKDARAYERKRILGEEEYLRSKLARIEAIKAEDTLVSAA